MCHMVAFFFTFEIFIVAHVWLEEVRYYHEMNCQTLLNAQLVENG